MDAAVFRHWADLVRRRNPCFAQGAADCLTSDLTETREMIMAKRASSAQLKARVRALENSATWQDTRFDALSLSVNELHLQGPEANTLLQELAPRP